MSGQCVLGWGVFGLFFFCFFCFGGGRGCIVNIRTFIYLIKNNSGWKYTVVFNQLNSRYRIKIEVKIQNNKNTARSLNRPTMPFCSCYF